MEGFWVCRCKRQVPQRIERCRCGQTQPMAETGSSSSGFLWLFLMAVAIAGAGWGIGRAGAPEKVAREARLPVLPVREVEVPQPLFVVHARQEAPVAQAPVPVPAVIAPPVQLAPQQILISQAPQPEQQTDSRAEEMQWRQQTLRVEAALIQTFEGYRSSVCREKQAGIPVASGERDYLNSRADYIAARNTAAAYQDTARRSRVLPGWVDIDWQHFPEPLGIDVMNTDMHNLGWCR